MTADSAGGLQPPLAPQPLDELVSWALAVPLSSDHHVGADRARVVLIALCSHANRSLRAFPGAETLAGEINGLTRRDVRNALALLELRHVISRDGTVGRATRYRIHAAGIPALNGTGGSAGIPASTSAGDVAGDVAGGSAGIPAPNGTEQNTAAARAKETGKVNDYEATQVTRVSAALDVDEAAAADAIHQWARHRPDVRSPFGVIASMSPDAIRTDLGRYRSQPPTPPCPDCRDSGWLEDPKTHLPARKCTHPRRAVA